MLIDFLNLAGERGVFNSRYFIHVRTSYPEWEPENAISVRLDAKSFESITPLEDVTAALRAHMPVCELTTPNGLPFRVASDRLLTLEPPTPGHNPHARAVLTLMGPAGQTLTRSVRETVDEAREAVKRSRDDWTTAQPGGGAASAVAP